MRNSFKIALSFLICILVLLLGVALGSIYVPFGDILAVIYGRVFSTSLPSHIPSVSVSIIWNLRLPRALLAFLVGGSLAVSGTV
ncbi:MAG TPA: ABC transporter permease, partial [Clostridiales bacterium]|nr:ABC transporter permease [Clostridiales bacterium]